VAASHASVADTSDLVICRCPKHVSLLPDY